MKAKYNICSSCNDKNYSKFYKNCYKCVIEQVSKDLNIKWHEAYDMVMAQEDYNLFKVVEFGKSEWNQ